ncbi:MAG: Wzz/FepE/Etk N-terminal domain-containing protein, partial [Candidatus Kapaibacterium sp.]
MDFHDSREEALATMPDTPAQSSAKLYDYLTIVWRYKRFLTIFVLVGMLLSIAYVMTIPYTYIATAKLMPPEKESGPGSNFTSLIQSGGIDLLGLGGSPSGQVFSEILQSRTLSDSLIERLDLIERLGLPESRIVAIDELKARIGVEEAKSGVIDISFTLSTPRF